MAAQRGGQDGGFVGTQRPFARGLQQRRQAVGGGRVVGKTQQRGQVRVVLVADLGRLFHPALGLEWIQMKLFLVVPI